MVEESWSGSGIALEHFNLQPVGKELSIPPTVLQFTPNIATIKKRHSNGFCRMCRLGLDFVTANEVVDLRLVRSYIDTVRYFLLVCSQTTKKIPPEV